MPGATGLTPEPGLVLGLCTWPTGLGLVDAPPNEVIASVLTRPNDMQTRVLKGRLCSGIHIYLSSKGIVRIGAWSLQDPDR